MPAEKKQIQNWLSCTGDAKQEITKEERENIEEGIVGQVQAYVTSSLFRPEKNHWWQKITTLF
jgi:hypothetical protein